MSRTRIFPMYTGWRVLGGCFVCAALALGFTSYIFGMFVVPVTAEFGISRATINNGMIASMIGTAIMGPIAGAILDRYPARWLFILGGVLFGGSLVLVSRSHSLAFMGFLIAVPMSIGTALCGLLGANTVVVRWFEGRRGRALGLLSLSATLGGFISQPLAAFLIAQFGWRDALAIMGIGAVSLVILVTLFMIRDRPSGNERLYDQEFKVSQSQAPASVAVPTRNVWTNRQIFSNGNFWKLALGIGILFAVEQAVLASQVPFFQDMGLGLSAVALLVSIKVLSAMGGKLLVGILADKVDLRVLYIGVACSNMMLLTIYCLQPSFEILLVAVALFGIAVGGVFPLWATMLAWVFGPHSYGKVMGIMLGLIQSPLAVIALRSYGEVHDRAGSYTPAFIVSIVLVGCSIGLVWMLRIDSSEPRADEVLGGNGKLGVSVAS